MRINAIVFPPAATITQKAQKTQNFYVTSTTAPPVMADNSFSVSAKTALGWLVYVGGNKPMIVILSASEESC
jgi:hypothetical protein